MVYLNISVNNIDETITYYSEKLSLFEYRAGRLIFKVEKELIIDMYEIGSKYHNRIFEKDEHVISSFWVFIEKTKDQTECLLKLKDRIKSNNIEYEEIEDLGGQRLNFIDPSGNKFSIHANHGVIK